MGTGGSKAASGASGASWLWDDNGVWKPYSAAAEKILETAFSQSKPHATLTFGSQQYKVDFSNMTQQNTRTGFARAVQRLVAGLPTPASTPGGPTGWLWQDDHGWAPYGPTEAAALTAAQAAGQAGVDFQFGATRYHVDFATMTQTNTVTGFQRPIRFAPAAGAGGGAGAAGASGASATSGGDALSFGVIHTEVCDPVSAATAADATRGTVASLTGWRTAASWEELKEQSCSVCIMDFDADDDALEDIVMLGQCSGHYFHADCIVQCFKFSVKCPICSTPYATMIGKMPKGTMTVTRCRPGRYTLAGYEGENTLVVQYKFPSGIQGEGDPNPGQAYSGTNRTGFLPDTEEGREVAELLVRAFRNRQSFVIGTSVTTGRSNCVVWNGIHHKTNTRGGPTRFGYPDDTYFARVKAELALVGIVPPPPRADDDDEDVDESKGGGEEPEDLATSSAAADAPATSAPAAGDDGATPPAAAVVDGDFVHGHGHGAGAAVVGTGTGATALP